VPRKWFVFALVMIVLIGGVTIYLRNRVNFDDLSFDQLATGGYYAYVLPDTFTEQSGWTRTIHMNSFTWQCEWHNDLWNPVEVLYKDKSGKLAFEINIEELDAIFEDSKATETVSVNADWIPTRTGTAYPLSNATYLKVYDTLGMEVVFSSNMKLDDTLKIIPAMQYMGPHPTSISDPWKKACGV